VDPVCCSTSVDLSREERRVRAPIGDNRHIGLGLRELELLQGHLVLIVPRVNLLRVLTDRDP